MKQTEDALGKGMERPAPHQGNTGDKTADLKELDTAALDNPELVNSVEERLANLRDLTAPSRPGRIDPAVESDDEEDTDETPKDTPADDTAGKDSGGKKPDKPDDSDSSTLDDDTKVLPEAYVRAATSYGWTREDAIEFFNSDPERALTTFSNIYQTRNRASAEFAAIGRQYQEKHEESTEVQKPSFPQVDEVKLREKYGEEAEPLIEMLKAQNQTLNQLASQLPKPSQKLVKKDRVFESTVEESGVEQQIHSFFESDAMKPWEAVYGKLEFGQTWEDLTPGQRAMRQKLLVRADQIAGGAHLQRVDMKLSEALENAHLLVTQQYRDKVLIDGIKAKVVQRAKAISVKPSAGTRKPGKDAGEEQKSGTRTREQLVTDTQKKLNRVFGGSA